MKGTHDCELIDLYHFLGKKWSAVLLHNIHWHPITYNELNKLTQNKISSVLLSKRIKEMQKLKLIKKEIINDRISYMITSDGNELKDLLHHIKKWAIKNNYDLPVTCKHNKCVCKEIFD